MSGPNVSLLIGLFQSIGTLHFHTTPQRGSCPVTRGIHYYKQTPLSGGNLPIYAVVASQKLLTYPPEFDSLAQIGHPSVDGKGY